MSVAAELIRAAEAEGVRVRLIPEGGAKISGDPEAVRTWAPRLREYKAAVLEILRAGVGPHRRWLLRYADGSIDSLTCTPPATLAEVRARYPHAWVEPVHEPDVAPWR